VDVLVTVLDDLGENLGIDVGERDAVVGAVVLDHVNSSESELLNVIIFVFSASEDAIDRSIQS